MSDNNRNPILYNGEAYSQVIIKRTGPPSQIKRPEYSEAKEHIISEIEKFKNDVSRIPQDEKLPNEVILRIQMYNEFTAKSFYPNSIFDSNTNEKFGFKEIGSRSLRSYASPSETEKPISPSKVHFIRANYDSLDKLKLELQKEEDGTTKIFKTDIRRISNLGLFPPEYKIQGISEDWEKGILEAVLHPLDIDKKVSLELFYNKLIGLDVPEESIRIKEYDSGIVFVSFLGTKKILDVLSRFNPLRAIQILPPISKPNFLRSRPIGNGPIPPLTRNISNIKIGLLDGGVNKDNPYLKDFVTGSKEVTGSEDKEFVEHGCSVAGLLLYGPLNQYSKSDTLPNPEVFIQSFTIISSTTQDIEMYDAIDAIERIIPANEDIKVYNLSLGPKGPIQDDNISRFTYAIDQLIIDNDVLMCVAVGNSGEEKDFERIQSPSDAVNALSIGAFTYSHNGSSIIKAPYSCIGPGREGSKLKPDLIAFGGCDNHPLHVIGEKFGMKGIVKGTSFSTPQVSQIAAKLIGNSNGLVDPLTAKCLLIHKAEILSHQHSVETGHGMLPQEEEILSCVEKSYTLIYKGEIEWGKYVEYGIPWISEITEGKVQLKWTIAVMTDVDRLSTDDYTSSSIGFTFYPNKHKFKFQSEDGAEIDGEFKKSCQVDISEDPEKAKRLIEAGFTQNSFPSSSACKSAIGNDEQSDQYRSEHQLRADLKWDSIEIRHASKMATSLKEPIFHIHALGRGKRTRSSKVKFVAVLELIAQKAEIDIYNEVLTRYGALIPIKVRTQVQQKIKV